jgi:hypothetical protein
MNKRTIINLIISITIVALLFIGWQLVYERDDPKGIGNFFLLVYSVCYSVLTSIILLPLIIKYPRLVLNIFFLTSWIINCIMVYLALSFTYQIVILKVEGFDLRACAIILGPSIILAIVQTVVFIKTYKHLRKATISADVKSN